MGHEQALPAPGRATRDAERGHLVGQRLRMQAGQPAQRRDHRRAAGQFGAAAIGTKLALAGEPHHDHRSEDAQHQFGDDQRDEEGRPVAPLVAEDHAVDGVADDPGQEHHEGVDHPLDERERDHVAVGGMRDLVAQHGLGLLARQLTQQPARDGHQGLVAAHAGREGVDLIGIVDTDLGHTDAGLLGLPPHGLHQPGLGCIGRGLDHPHAHRAFGSPLRQRQRQERAAEAHQRRERQQCTEIEALGAQVGLQPEQAGRQRKHQHDGEVGGEEQRDALHGRLQTLRRTTPTPRDEAGLARPEQVSPLRMKGKADRS